MKTFKFTVIISSLVGKEKREVEIQAKTEKAALKALSSRMGNRDYSVFETKENGVVTKSFSEELKEKL